MTPSPRNAPAALRERFLSARPCLPGFFFLPFPPVCAILFLELNRKQQVRSAHASGQRQER